MNYKKMTKDQLIKKIESLESSIDYLYTDEQLSESYDQGYDAGYDVGINESEPEELSDHELKQFGDNILRIG